jgi:hypothetical protein
MGRLIDWLRFEVWGTGMGFLVLLFLGTTLALAFFFHEKTVMAVRKTTPEIVIITRFGMDGSKYRASVTAVYAQDAKGLVGRVVAQPYQIFGCRVGDEIRAERYGIALTLHPAPCPIKLEQRDIIRGTLH